MLYSFPIMLFRSVGYALLASLYLLILNTITLAQVDTNVSQSQDAREAEARRLLEQARQQGQSSRQIAIENFQQAQRIYQEIGDRDGELDVLAGLVYTYSMLCQDQQVITTIQQGISIARELSPESELVWLGNLREFYSQKEQLTQAIQIEQQALSIAQESNLNFETATALLNLGGLHERENDNQIAINYYQRSLLVLDQERGSIEYYYYASYGISPSDVLPNLIRIHEKSGNVELAASLTQRLIQEHRRESQLMVAQQIIRQSGSLPPEQAVVVLQEALNIYRDFNYYPGEASVLYRLAHTYRDLNQPRQVIEISQNALEIVQQIGADNVPIHQPDIEFLSLIANSYSELGDAQAYIEIASQLANLVRETDPRLYATVLQNLAQNYRVLGETQRAEATLEELSRISSIPSIRFDLPPLILPPRSFSSLHFPRLGWSINFGDSSVACRPRSS